MLCGPKVFFARIGPKGENGFMDHKENWKNLVH